MKRVTLIAGIFGLGLTLWMLAQFGVSSIFSLVMTGGWGILAAIAFHSVQVFFQLPLGAPLQAALLARFCP